MPDTKTRTGAIALAAVIVISLFAPAVAGAAASEELSVSTEEPTNITENSATLQGNLTGLGNATNATVSFEYWPENDAANATSVSVDTVNESGTFDATIDGLSANSTYVVVAEANASDGETATGDEVTFVTDDAFDVHTDEATNVNESSATLRGTLTDLDGSSNATVWFEYWQQGDADNASATSDRTLNETAAFSEDVTGLASNVTYVYVAYAEPADGDEVEAGGEATFDTVVEEQEDQSFGQQLSAYMDELTRTGFDGPFGVHVSDWVVANNPGADNKPEHAGQGSDGGSAENASSNGNSSDGDRGPPDHANNDKDDEDDEEEDDDEGGPPDHANNDKDE